ncbi:Nup133 N terminal like-domain-containing protein, partial [Dimargaris cristalligena]
PAAELQALLSSSATEIQAGHTADAKYPTLDQLVQTTTSGEYNQALFPDWVLFVKTQSVPLPDSLFDQYDLLHCRCFMGLFPEIQRAWLTIDHRLFLWNYEDGSEFHAYEEQDQIIISVALVKPRTDVLDSQINHLLVLATPLEAILLGVASRPSKKKAGGEVTFYSTQLNVPTDNVSIHHMVGSAAGRIFMAGSDSNLYEIVYAAEEGWFSRRCRKVNLTASIYSYLMPSFLTGSESDPVIHMVVDDSRQ